MDIPEEHPALRNDILSRPRLERLLEKCLEYPLTTLISPPGYGKTIAVADFINRKALPSAWIGPSVLDNSPVAFWNKLRESLKSLAPSLSKLMEKLRFPETVQEFDEFIVMVKKEVSFGEPVIIVLDDYDIITNEAINHFVNQCINVNFTEYLQWHYIVISNARLTATQSPFHRSLFSIGEYYKIGTSELAFSFEETRQLFQNCGNERSDYQVKKILEKTDGWPVCLQLICQHKSENDIREVVTELFESQYFSHFRPELKDLLIKLSFLPRFSAEILKEISSENMAQNLEDINANIFIDINYLTQIYRFQTLYHDFLASKNFLIEDAEKIRILNSAADWFYHRECYADAQELYVAANNYEGIVKCVEFLIKQPRYSFSEELKEVLESIPAEFTEQNPWVTFYLGCLYLQNGQIIKSKNTLSNLLEKYETTDAEHHHRLLGETHRFLADISLLHNDLDRVEHLKKAVEYLPNGSTIISKNIYGVGENSGFYLPQNENITVSEMVAYVKESSLYADRIANGFMYGYDYLFESEAATALGDMKRSQTAAEQAVRKAKKMDQHDIVLLGYFAIMRAAILSQDYEKMKESIDRFETYYAQIENEQLSDLRDLIHALFNIKIGNKNSIAAWIKQANFDSYEEKPLWNGRNVIISAIYALHDDDPARALSLLTLLDDAFYERGLWTARVISHTIKASAYYALDDHETALFEFWTAYKMCEPNEVLYPLAEMGSSIDSLIRLAKKTTHFSFNSLYLEKLRTKAAETRTAIKAVRSQVQKEDSGSKYSFTLSERERYTLSLLSRGLTREEMANIMGISVNGVKKQLSNVYKKLGAHNRAEAVYIASINDLM